MFPNSFFARRYFAPRYFPRAGTTTPPVVEQVGGFIRRDILALEGVEDEEIFMIIVAASLLQ